MPVPQQLLEIPILPARYPDPGKAVFHHQSQNQLRVLPIRLLLAYSPGPNLGRVSDPQLNSQVIHKPLEPTRLTARFHPHAHLRTLRREIAVNVNGGVPDVTWTPVSATFSIGA